MRVTPYTITLSRAVAATVMLTVLLPNLVEGQVAQRFTIGGRDMVNMTFAGTPVGELPTGLKLLSGTVDVVDVGGVHMLRASSESELELPLPQILPSDFTIEFEFIPKQCCNPQDLAVEGTSVGHSNPGSSQITWHRNRVTVIGGGDSFAADMPDVLANSTPGMPTIVQVVMQGATLKLYTNGRRLYTLSDRKFVRAQKLWIYLGGQDDGKYAVYVSRIRVIDNGPPVGPVAQNSPTGGTGAGAGTQPPPATGGGGPGSGSGPTASGNPPLAISGFSMTPEIPWGLTIRWNALAGAANYRVEKREGVQPPTTRFTQNSNTLPSYSALDDLLRPATHYEYQVTALQPNGTTLGTSQVLAYDTPPTWPRITNLTANVGAATTVTDPRTGSAGPGYFLSWNWDVAPGMNTWWVTLDRTWIDPATNQPKTMQLNSGSPFVLRPGVNVSVSAGETVRFCVAALVDPFTRNTLASPTCLDTTLPLPPAPVMGVNAGLVPATAATAPTPAPLTLAAPGNLRVTRINTSPAEAILEWDPVQYNDAGTLKTASTYQLSGTGIATPATVNGTQMAIPLSPAISTYTWSVLAVVPNGTNGLQTSPPGTFTYVCRYRIVALGVTVFAKTYDDILTFDGVEDEIYLSTIVNVTNRSLSSSTYTLNRSPTFGDTAGFPNRVKAGNATLKGGITTGDKVPYVFDPLGPIAATQAQRFPMVLWEGALDDQAMVVVHPMLWEEDKGGSAYIGWVNTVTARVRAGYTGTAAAPTLQAIQSLRDGGRLGPADGSQVVNCVDPPSNRFSLTVCVAGEDRPIGLSAAPNNINYWMNDRVLVLTRDAIERSLQVAVNRQQGQVTGPGYISINFNDQAMRLPFGYGFYTLYLRVERVP
jgi:hypothetical protein